jgi:hypothetical protein
VQDRRENLNAGVSGERPTPRDQFVDDGAKAEDVGPDIGRLPLCLLGRHIGRGPEHYALAGLGHVDFAVQHLGETEVEKFGRTAACDQNVRGLEIPMQDSPAMGLLERVSDRQDRANRLGDTQRTAQRSSVDVLEHEIVGTDVVDLADVRMVQRRDRPRFLLEPIEVADQPLDRDGPPQSRVACPPHLAHTARADTRFEQIRATLIARCPVHWRDSSRV